MNEHYSFLFLCVFTFSFGWNSSPIMSRSNCIIILIMFHSKIDLYKTTDYEIRALLSTNVSNWNHWSILTIPNIAHCAPPLIGDCQYLHDENIFGDRFFYFSYLHIRRILAKFQYLYHYNFWNYDRFSQGGAHKMMILWFKHCISSKYLK